MASPLINDGNTDITFNFDLANPDGDYPPKKSAPAARLFRKLTVDDTDGEGVTMFIEVTETVKASLLSKVFAAALGEVVKDVPALVPGGAIAVIAAKALGAGIGTLLSRVRSRRDLDHRLREIHPQSRRTAQGGGYRNYATLEDWLQSRQKELDRDRGPTAAAETGTASLDRVGPRQRRKRHHHAIAARLREETVVTRPGAPELKCVARPQRGRSRIREHGDGECVQFGILIRLKGVGRLPCCAKGGIRTPDS